MPFVIRLGGKTRYPRYIGDIRPVLSNADKVFPRNETIGVRSKNATEFETEFDAQNALDALLAAKDKLQPHEVRELDTATIEEV